MTFNLGDHVEATDHYGSYYKQPGVVTGFDINLLGRRLVLITTTDQEEGENARLCFYPSELTKIEKTT
jgi:hypothetical protein